MTRDTSTADDEQHLPSMPAPHRFSLRTDAFLLDVDGTILDIAAAPEDVNVPELLKVTLGRLQQNANGAVALVSGREVASLDSLFAPLTIAAIGCHGAEWRVEAGGPVTARSEPLSDEIKRSLIDLVSNQPKIRVEDKGYTLAFHYRRAPDLKVKLEQRLLAFLEPLSSSLCLLHGKSVIEVKPRGFDKGEALQALMGTPHFLDRRPVFFGDDTTDEDAFAAARELGGIGIAVGRQMPETDLMLPNPHAVRLWLARIAGK